MVVKIGAKKKKRFRKEVVIKCQMLKGKVR